MKLIKQVCLTSELFLVENILTQLVYMEDFFKLKTLVHVLGKVSICTELHIRIAQLVSRQNHLDMS
jgi:hypothetical protein